MTLTSIDTQVWWRCRKDADERLREEYHGVERSREEYDADERLREEYHGGRRGRQMQGWYCS